MLYRSVLAALALFAALGGRGHRAEAARARLPALDPPGDQLAGAFACYRQARRLTLLGQAQTGELCEGANEAGPVDCYVEARARTFLSVADAISLCRCATSATPVACYREGHETTTLDPAEIQRLCSPSLRLRLGPGCSTEP